MDTLTRNLKYAVRRLARSPLFTVVAVLSLSLGIGANTAMFSLVNAILIRDLPFSDRESLVDLFEASEGFSHGTFSYPDYIDLREASSEVFADVGGMQLALLSVDQGQNVETVPAEAVTGNYFSLLGVTAHVGRMLTDHDHVAAGAHPVAVLGYDFWQNRFAGNPDVLGSEIRLAGRPYTIVGVAPRTYVGTLRGISPSILVPIMMLDELEGTSSSVLEARGNQSMFVKGRLLPGVTTPQMEGILDRMSATLRQEHPEQWEAAQRFVYVPTADVIMNPMVDRVIVPAAGVIMMVVGLVLLIACANLASFLLARASDRRKEIAIRLAMGARRRTLVGQLLTETVLLSTLGGLAGVFMAMEALNWLSTADLPVPIPITLDLSMDPTVLGFSVLVSVTAGILFGLVPALQGTNPDVAPTLRDESTGAKSAGTLRTILVGGQVAVSVVLLVAAGLFLRSLDASRHIDPGFGHEPTGILDLVTPAQRYSPEESLIYLEALADRIAEIPGVETVGYTTNLHLNPLSTNQARITVDGVEPPPGQEYLKVDWAAVSDDFFDAAGIELLAGRPFDASDEDGGLPVAVVNAEFAARYLPEGEAVGRTIDVNETPTQVVGVAATAKIRQIGEPPRPFVYQSRRQSHSIYSTLLARTTGDGAATALQMLRTARELDPEVRILAAKSMERHLGAMFIARELGAAVIAGFAILALLLASIGLYGAVAYAVSRRSREMGIRLSLGAESSSVVWMLTGGGMKVVAIGGVVGLVLAALMARLMSTLLYGVPPLDPVTFLGVPLALGLVALLASWVPARRVARMDPVRALRSN